MITKVSAFRNIQKHRKCFSYYDQNVSEIVAHPAREPSQFRSDCAELRL